MKGSEDFKEEVTELSLATIDSVFQLLTNNEILDAIPVVSSICKAGKAALSIPNILFLRKLERFILKINEKTTKAERERFAKIVKSDKKKMEELYEIILIKIDKFDDITKPEIFAKILASYISGRIEKPEFDALSHALSASSLKGLATFSKVVIRDLLFPYRGKLDEFKNLISSDLINFELEQMFQRDQLPYHKIKYSLTELGKLYAFIAEDLEIYIQMTKGDSSRDKTSYKFIINESLERSVRSKLNLS